MEQQQIILQLEKGKDPKLLWQCPAASESSCELPAGEMQPHACATSGNLVCEGNTGIFILPALPKGHRQLHRRDAAHPVNTQRFGSRNSRKDCRAQSIPPAESTAPASSACCSKLGKVHSGMKRKGDKRQAWHPRGGNIPATEFWCAPALCLNQPLGALDFQTQSKIPATEKHPCCCILELLSRSDTNTLPPLRHQETSAVNNCQTSSLSTKVYIPSNSQIIFVTLAKNNLENMQRVMISDLQNIVLVTFHFVIPAMDKWFC